MNMFVDFCYFTHSLCNCPLALSVEQYSIESRRPKRRTVLEQALRTNWALKSRNRNYSVSVRSKFNSIGDFYFPLFHRPFSECYLLLSFAINLSVEQSAERQLHTQTMKGYLFWNDVLVMFGEFLMKLNLANDSIKVIIEWIISEQWALWFFGTQSLHVISLNFECSKSTQSNKLRWCCTEKILASCRFVSACNITASTE